MNEVFNRDARPDSRLKLWTFDVVTCDRLFAAWGIGNVCPGVSRDTLWPRGVWPDDSAYETTAKKLADLFRENFRKYEFGVSAEIRSAGPA